MARWSGKVITCPYCEYEIAAIADIQFQSQYGPKFGRCPQCKAIYRTGKILYSDLSKEEKKEYKKNNIKFYFKSIFLSIVFLLIFTICMEYEWRVKNEILGGILSFLGSISFLMFMLFCWITFRYFIERIGDKTKILKNINKKDKELYELEVNESEKLVKDSR